MSSSTPCQHNPPQPNDSHSPEVGAGASIARSSSNGSKRSNRKADVSQLIHLRPTSQKLTLRSRSSSPERVESSQRIVDLSRSSPSPPPSTSGDTAIRKQKQKQKHQPPQDQRHPDTMALQPRTTQQTMAQASHQSPAPPNYQYYAGPSETIHTLVTPPSLPEPRGSGYTSSLPTVPLQPPKDIPRENALGKVFEKKPPAGSGRGSDARKGQLGRVSPNWDSEGGT